VELHYCPLHAHEVVRPSRLPDGASLFECPLTTGHVEPGPLRWLKDNPPPALSSENGAAGAGNSRQSGGPSGLAKELDLARELPAALAEHRGRWVEYGVLEHTYARRRPDDFARLVEIYRHTAIAAKAYTASSYLAGRLGDLARLGTIALRFGPATGRWNYNVEISWWTLAPAPDWADRTSWQDLRETMNYIPGSTE